MTQNESLVLSVIKEHQGSGNPIAKREISEEIGLTPREVERCVRSLVTDFGMLIGSSCTPPYGYFVIISDGEVLRYKRQLISRIQKLNERVAAVDMNRMRRTKEMLELEVGV